MKSFILEPKGRQLLEKAEVMNLSPSPTDGMDPGLQEFVKLNDFGRAFNKQHCCTLHPHVHIHTSYWLFHSHIHTGPFTHHTGPFTHHTGTPPPSRCEQRLCRLRGRTGSSGVSTPHSHLLTPALSTLQEDWKAGAPPTSPGRRHVNALCLWVFMYHVTVLYCSI